MRLQDQAEVRGLVVDLLRAFAESKPLTALARRLGELQVQSGITRSIRSPWHWVLSLLSCGGVPPRETVAAWFQLVREHAARLQEQHSTEHLWAGGLGAQTRLEDALWGRGTHQEACQQARSMCSEMADWVEGGERISLAETKTYTVGHAHPSL